jgi:iron complex transport system ATP-binding protein
VEVLGHRLGRVDMRELRGWIGHVDPRQPLDDRLRVEQAVLTGATGSNGWVPRWKPTAEQLRRADELMELVGVARLRNAGLTTLSQGERGRMLVVRALMSEPHLLLDEPSTGLDLAARERLLTSLDNCAPSTPGWPACWSPTTWRSCRPAPRTRCCSPTDAPWPPARSTTC